MASHMHAKPEATVEDLYLVPGKAELVNGELVLMSPTGGLPGYAATEIVVSLREYARRTRHGYAVGDNVGFLVNLPHRKSFCPDAAFFTGELRMGFLQGAPVFAVEVRS
jgi:Uma2 family endonuclease